jgi:hypothetical protein
VKTAEEWADDAMFHDWDRWRGQRVDAFRAIQRDAYAAGYGAAIGNALWALHDATSIGHADTIIRSLPVTGAP